MGAFGRGSRPGRRLSSSSPASSPFISTVTIAVFVAFCLLAVWMLSANSFSPSSHTSTDNPAVRFRASLASSHAKPSRPFIVYKDTGSDGGDSDGGGGGVGEEDAAAEEKLAAPVVSERADVGGEGREKQEEEERRRQQQRAEGQQGRAFDGDSHRERPTEGGTDGNGDEAKSQELPSHTSSYEDNNGDGQQQPQQEEEAMENTVQLEEESGQMETRGHRSDGEGDDQQQHPLQQETEDVGEDSQKLQRQQESEDGGSREDESQSRQEQTDAEGDQNQMEQMTEREAGGAEGQDENYQQQVEGNEKPVMDSLEDTEREVVKGLDEEPQQQGTDEKLTDEPHVSASLTDGAHQEAEVLPDGDGSVQNMPWSTQADQSHSEKERRKESKSQEEDGSGGGNGDIHGHEWKLCNATAGPDYIPCLDNEEALRHVHNTRHFQHRERHCPEEAPTCLVPLPKGYRRSIEWPKSRDSIWYNNVPHTKLALVKGHQNWLKVTGEYLIFPGGGTQFIHGALHYIEFIQKSVRNIAWGKHTRVVLDVGCGVASFGGYLFEKDVITMSFAPKDEHEAQIQLALERGIPAISAVMGSQRLPFPSKVFDLVHCARCRVPWHAEGGTLLLELNRVLRPGGYFVWSATPVYQKLKEDVEIWREMTSLTKSMCWELITIRKDRLNSVGAAIYQKPTSNECYDNRKQRIPPMCNEEDDPDAAWYVPLQSCMHRVPTDASERGSQWPQEWPRRLRLPPSWLNSSEVGVYGKPAPSDFTADYGHWKRVIAKSYLHGMGVDWSKVRNVMDMRAVYGGFAAALKDLKIWVMNVVNVDSPDTLPIIYERGLFGIYHDWCESFSTYPRTYDLLHADQLFSNLKKRCNIVHVVVEVDRILRPGGKLLIRDEPKVVSEIESQLRSLHWEVHLTFAKGREGILCAEKSDWRPEIFMGSS